MTFSDILPILTVEKIFKFELEHMFHFQCSYVNNVSFCPLGV